LRHRAIICLVIVAREMQQPMQHEYFQLARQRMPLLPGLLSRRLHADRQIALFLPLDERIGREAQHIRRFVFAAKLPVQLAKSDVRGKQNGNMAFQADCILRPGKESLKCGDGGDSFQRENAAGPRANRGQRRIE
jgi:hypothetical protein